MFDQNGSDGFFSEKIQKILKIIPDDAQKYPQLHRLRRLFSRMALIHRPLAKKILKRAYQKIIRAFPNDSAIFQQALQGLQTEQKNILIR